MAEALVEWLPRVIQKLDPWMSKLSIASGARWRDDVARELATCKFGILCLTPENLTSEWIHFEAGAITKHLEHACVVPYLLEGDKTLRDPLGQFQSSKASMEDTFSLVKAMNAALSEGSLSELRLREQFDLVWGKLETKLQTIPPPSADPPPSSPRSTAELMEEILDRLRAIETAVSRLARVENTIATVESPLVIGGATPSLQAIESAHAIRPADPNSPTGAR